MKINHWIDEDKKKDGCAYCCAEVECESININIYERDFTFDKANKKVIKRLKELSNEITDLINTINITDHIK